MKKLLIMFMAVTLLMLCVAAPAAFAADTYTASVSASSASINKGEDVTVSVTMPSNLPKLAVMGIVIAYDDDAFSVKSAPNANWMFGDSGRGNEAAGNYFATDFMNGDDLAGTTLNFVFTSKSDAKGGDYTFAVAFDENNTGTAMGEMVKIEVGEASVSIICEHASTELQNVKEATCSETGYTGDEVCKNCGTTVKTGGSIDKKPHDYKTAVTAPTCTEQGYTTYTCTCSHSYKADYVDAFGHTGGVATCVDLAVCTRCGEEYGTVNEDNHAAIGELEGAKAATCTEDGATGTGSCSACGTELKKSEVIPMLGHAMDDGVVTTEPGCEEEGVRTYSCTRDGCDHQEFEKIDPVGHDWDEGVVTTEATCEGEGEMTFTCKNDETHTYNEKIGAIGHDWELTETVTAPTCEEDGEGLYTCRNDAAHTKTDVIGKLGHDWDEGVVTKEPTTDAEGEKIYTCKNDPSHTWSEVLNKLKPSGSGSTGGDKDASDVPETGDETPVALYALMGVLCMAGAVVLLSLRKKFER